MLKRAARRERSDFRPAVTTSNVRFSILERATLVSSFDSHRDCDSGFELTTTMNGGTKSHVSPAGAIPCARV